MRARAPRVVAVLIGSLLYASGTDAKLIFRTDDVYVRGADLIVVADCLTTASVSDVSVAIVTPSSVISGELSGTQIQVRSFTDADEDMPVFRVGQRSLLFLRANRPYPGIYSCFGAEAGKRDYAGEGAAGWPALLARVAQLAEAKTLPNEDVRLAALIHLLDSRDMELAAAASNYVNQVVTGEEDEGWIIKPPKGSSDWSWDDYFARNVIAHRRKWRDWWRARER